MGFQVKIVGDFCNIRCSYCRNRDFNRIEKAVMSTAVLEKLFVFVNSSSHKKVRINWHGGEPLLAGKDFFHHIVRLEREYPDKVWVNAVQTNATLIDSVWAKFFSDNGFYLGVSVDGTERVHDIDRVNTVGRGTYKRAMRGVNILRDYGIYPGVICTITRKTVKYAEEIFLGLVQAGFKNIAFNAFYNTASESDGDEYGLTDKDWSGFLGEVFRSWLEVNNETIRVRELDAILAWTQGKSTNECSFRGSCDKWFAVDHFGDIYPCERFGKKFHFGNIDSFGDYKSLITSQSFLFWRDSIKLLPDKCHTCTFLSLCNNGCSSHRRVDSQGVPLYTFCESRLEFYNFVQNHIKKEV